ncbi:MAG: general secretion pathway protein K [Lentimonas sp.]|jgi:general secretion pathway protein K
MNHLRKKVRRYKDTQISASNQIRDHSGSFLISKVTPKPTAFFRIKQSTPRQGSVLIAVLAIILLITFIVTRFMDEAIEDLEYRALFNEPADVRSYAYSMLEVALATIQEVALIDDGKLYAGEQGWNDPVNYADIKVPNGWEVQIEIHDEGGKLPINTMSEELLNRLLEEELEFDFGTARELSSTLLDWIDEDDRRRLNGAESDDYLSNDPPYRSANRPLQSLEELRLLKVWSSEFFDDDGVPNDQFAQLSGLVSVLNTGAVNLNAAPEPVLDILSLENGWQQDALFDGLEQPYLKRTPSSNTNNSGVEVGLLRVTVRLLRGEVPFVISALVEPDFNSGNSTGSNSRSSPGRSSDDAPKTGSIDEQNALAFPFKIVRISEYTQGDPQTPSGRNSALDIGKGSTYF